MQKHINYLKQREQLEQSKIEVTRVKIKKVMEVRKTQNYKNEQLKSLKTNMDSELNRKKQQIRAIREKEEITKLTSKMAIQYK